MSKCYEDGLEHKRKLLQSIKGLDKIVAQPIEEKVAHMETLIKKALKKHKCAVACSFGKDSVLVLYFVRQFDPDIKVVFCDTGVEFPETVAFAKELREEWNLNLTITKPDQTFWQVVNERGFPQLRYRRRVPPCCEVLKDKPALKAYRALGIECTFTGLSFDESFHRKWLIAWHGDYYRQVKQKIWKCHPVAYFTTKEVWTLLAHYGIPVNPAYAKYKIPRLGCLPCTRYIGWENELRRVNPKMYKFVQSKRGQSLIEAWGGGDP